METSPLLHLFASSQYGNTDQRTDIFQLGVVFYELVTGVQPFTGENMSQVIFAILTNPDPLTSCSGHDHRRAHHLQMSEKRPEDRDQSVQEMFADLSAAMREQDRS